MSGNPFDRKDVTQLASTPGDTRSLVWQCREVEDGDNLMRDLFAIQRKHPELYITVKIGNPREQIAWVRIRRRRR